MIDNKSSKKGGIGLLIFISIVSILFIIIGNACCKFQMQTGSSEDFATAKVVSVEDVSIDEGNIFTTTTVKFIGKVTSGDYKGEELEMTQTINDNVSFKPMKEVEEGDSIVVAYTLSMDGTQEEWYYSSHNRIFDLVFLTIIFLGMILFIGRKKGVTTIMSLIFTMGAIFLVYIPAILSGKNIYTSTIVIALFIILMSFGLISGLNKKTLCAIVGNMGGVILAGILAAIVNNIFDITGYVDENYAYLKMLDGNISLDLRAVVWGGIVIGSLGAIMDVSMSISSAMHELSLEMKNKSFYKMVTSGMNIGRDVIGTMTNTLILAYAGSSLAVILLFTAYNRNLLLLFNLEMITVEIIQAIVGSIGILLTVPATVFFSAWVFNMKSKPKIKEEFDAFEDFEGLEK